MTPAAISSLNGANLAPPQKTATDAMIEDVKKWNQEHGR